MAVVQRGDSFMWLKSGGMGNVNTTLREYFCLGLPTLAETRGRNVVGGARVHFFEMRISLSVSSTVSSG
jgi:hypothetical protein